MAGHVQCLQLPCHNECSNIPYVLKWIAAVCPSPDIFGSYFWFSSYFAGKNDSSLEKTDVPRDPHESPWSSHEATINHHLTIMKPALSNGDSCHLHVSPSLWLSRIHLAQGPQVPMSPSVQRHSTMLSSGMVDPCTDGMTFFWLLDLHICGQSYETQTSTCIHKFMDRLTDENWGGVCVCVFKCTYVYIHIYIYVCVYTYCTLYTLYGLYRL